MCAFWLRSGSRIFKKRSSIAGYDHAGLYFRRTRRIVRRRRPQTRRRSAVSSAASRMTNPLIAVNTCQRLALQQSSNFRRKGHRPITAKSGALSLKLLVRKRTHTSCYYRYFALSGWLPAWRRHSNLELSGRTSAVLGSAGGRLVERLAVEVAAVGGVGRHLTLGRDVRIGMVFLRDGLFARVVAAVRRVADERRVRLGRALVRLTARSCRCARAVAQRSAVLTTRIRPRFEHHSTPIRQQYDRSKTIRRPTLRP